jgi:hypothetical protein
LRCVINLYPEIQVARNYKTKENEVVARIKEAFPDFDWVHDKRVLDGCSKKRPDLLLDLGTHLLIAEIDENKHTTYDCSCENKRLMEISADVDHRPIVLIRFNPDGYVDANGTRVSSCWRTNKLGVVVISEKKKPEWESRIASLKSQIQYWIDSPTDKTIEIIELFY